MIALVCSEANAVVFHCRYRYKDWLHLGNEVKEIVRSIYSCDAKILQYGRNNESLTEIISDHIKSATNNDVKLINIEKQTYNQIPDGIINFFPNLEGFMMQDSNLKNISSADLRPYRRLKYLSLVGNDIQFLENDLFIHTPRIVYINLAWNLLKNIGTDIFESLTFLKSISFFRNPCSTAEVWEGTEDEFKAFRSDIAKRCKPAHWMVEREEERRKKRLNIIRRAGEVNFLKVKSSDL